jgi:uncharacterized protein
MQFKVKDIGESGLDVDLAVTPAWLAEACAELELRPDQEGVRFKGRIEPTGQDFLLRGHLTGGLLLPCARCLEPARFELDVDVSVVYVERAGEDDVEDDDDAVDAPDVLFFEEGVIDLAPELRDEIMLAVPVSVVCREDCLGLCPICGGNRNLTPCDCAEKAQQSQSKFAALAKLKS